MALGCNWYILPRCRRFDSASSEFFAFHIPSLTALITSDIINRDDEILFFARLSFMNWIKAWNPISSHVLYLNLAKRDRCPHFERENDGPPRGHFGIRRCNYKWFFWILFLKYKIRRYPRNANAMHANNPKYVQSLRRPSYSSPSSNP